MDGYFVVPPAPVMLHATYAPIAVPLGNSYQVNHAIISSFWSVRDLWMEESWLSQSETACASLSAQAQPPAYTPYVSMTPVVMISW
jgi:hypothetical protein